MKLAKFDNLQRQDSLFQGGEPDAHYAMRQIILVADNYDFGANSATDITTIENLDIYGAKRVCAVSVFKITDVRDAIAALATPFSGLSTPQKLIASKWFVADKTDRDAVHSALEQQDNAILLQGLREVDVSNLSFDACVTAIKDADKTDVDVTVSEFGDMVDDVLVVAMGDETTAITTGTDKVTLYAACKMYLSDVIGSLTTASTSGVVEVDIAINDTSLFSTTLTIDATESTSTTAATPHVLTPAIPVIAKGDKISFDIVLAGTGAKGLKITLIGKTYNP